MRTVVCDASPLIFLAKLDQLDLVPCLLGEQIFILQCEADELLSERAGQIERERLDQFFKKANVVNFEIADKQPTALSLCDQSTLRWAIDNDINWLLADERLLRRVAVEEGISVIGFLGLLTGAAVRKHITANKARELVDEAVSQHGCRISITVYQRVMEELDKFETNGNH